ncbi:MAG: hypothetical protein J6W49_02520, partial [Paludibacteraceae bacterium]|nr:hypothetical protein [Paludibacteraceae bacterium]
MENEDKYWGKFRIQSARAEWHDYDGGLYFVTICTEGRAHYFGEISGGEMQFTEIGRYVEQCISKVSEHNPYAEILSWVTMPNHIHLMVKIEQTVETVHAPSNAKNIKLPQTVHAPSLQQNRWKNEVVDEKMRAISSRKNNLSYAVGSFKSAVTKFANEHEIPFTWQRRFHDHIIRDT